MTSTQAQYIILKKINKSVNKENLTVIHEKSQMSSLSVISLITVKACKGLGHVSKLN